MEPLGAFPVLSQFQLLHLMAVFLFGKFRFHLMTQPIFRHDEDTLRKGLPNFRISLHFRCGGNRTGTDLRDMPDKRFENRFNRLYGNNITIFCGAFPHITRFFFECRIAPVVHLLFLMTAMASRFAVAWVGAVRMHRHRRASTRERRRWARVLAATLPLTAKGAGLCETRCCRSCRRTGSRCGSPNGGSTDRCSRSRREELGRYSSYLS